MNIIKQILTLPKTNGGKKRRYNLINQLNIEKDDKIDLVKLIDSGELVEKNELDCPFTFVNINDIEVFIQKDEKTLMELFTIDNDYINNHPIYRCYYDNYDIDNYNAYVLLNISNKETQKYYDISYTYYKYDEDHSIKVERITKTELKISGRLDSEEGNASILLFIIIYEYANNKISGKIVPLRVIFRQ